MKKLLKPACLAFYFLMLLAFFIIGIYYAGYIEAGKGQMLAAGAIVLGYGVLFGGIAFIASFFIAYWMPLKTTKIVNWILLLAMLGLWGYKFYEARQGNKARQEASPTPSKNRTTTEPVSSIALKGELIAMLDTKTDTSEKQRLPISSEKQLGLGFFIPSFYENNRLDFYGNINWEKGHMEHLPQDSLVLKPLQTGDFELKYAPPWLVPEAMKLDYGILYLKVTGVGHDFLKTEGNPQGQVTYVRRDAGRYLPWPEFLLSVNSVEYLPGKEQPVRIKPLEYAGDVTVSYDFITPKLIQGEWLYGILLNDAFKEVGKGWIRWRDGQTLLITYSLLS